MRYKIKAGLLGVAANFILLIVAAAFSNVFLVKISGIIHFLPLFIADISDFCGGENCVLYSILSFIIWVPLVGFAIGSLVGFLIKKIRERLQNI